LSSQKIKVLQTRKLWLAELSNLEEKPSLASVLMPADDEIDQIAPEKWRPFQDGDTMMANSM
jgi:hypothetical protein